LTLSNNRTTRIEINLNALRHNLNIVKKLIPQNCSILLPVKADAYGHGAVEVSKLAEKENITMLGVAKIDEGIELRKKAIKLPILIFAKLFDNEIKDIIKYNITPSVFYFEDAKKINNEAQKEGKKVNIHLKVDTGMGRNGCSFENAFNEVIKILNLPFINLEGIYTHFPCADEENKDFTFFQIKVFNKLKENLENKNIKISYYHAANSAAIMDIPQSYYNMVRPGIMAYGYHPSKEILNKQDLKPVLSLLTKIIFVKKVKENTPISYNHIYKTTKETTICTLPIGYADGLNRMLSNKGKILINDKLFPIVGRICMDQCLIDTNDYPVKEGDNVIIIGEGLWADKMADLLNTIPYEITCNLGNNINRSYIGG